MLCIVYVTLVGAFLGVVGILIERLIPPRWPRRWIWCVVLPLSLFLPGYNRFHHAWSVTEALQQTQNGQVAALAQPQLAILTPMWWQHLEIYNRPINFVWHLLSGLLIVWGVANAIRVWDIVADAKRRRSESSKPEIVDGVPVLITSQVGPATVGLLRSKVLVPGWVLALPGMQRRYVLRHEEEHRRAHDALLLFVASLSVILVPWNLAAWWQVRRLSLAVEMDCDNRVVSALGDAHAYGSLLLTVAQASSRGPRLQPAFLGIGSLERRLTQLVAYQPLRRFQQFLLPALAVILLSVVAWMPHPVAGPCSTTDVVTASAATSPHNR